MTVGTLIHSEILNDLKELGYRGEYRLRLFRIILGADSIFREFAIKAQDKERKGKGKPAGSDGLRKMVGEREAEMKRESKAV